MTKTFWIAHDGDMRFPRVCIYSRKPRVTAKGLDTMYVRLFCLKAFTKTTGIKLKPGETKRVQLVEVER